MSSDLDATDHGQSISGGSTPSGEKSESSAGDLGERVLAAATEIIEARGEAGLRISDVRERSGASVGAIYQRFGDREGLVEAVRVAQFGGAVGADVAALGNLVGTTSRDEFVAGLCEVARAAADTSRVATRWRRVSVVGSARRRPGLQKSVAQVQVDARNQLADLVQIGQERGLIRDDLSPDAVAAFVQAYTFGKILTELGHGTEVDTDEWVEVVRVLAEALVPTI